MDRLVKSLLLLLLVGTFSCSRSSDQTGIEIFPDMVHSVAYEAFSENPVTKDGNTMMYAPKGSIARGIKPFHYGVGEKEAIRAGGELKNPLAPTKFTLNRGKELYNNYCLVCHGDAGKGDGPLIPKFPNPPSFTSKTLKAYEDGRLFHIIVRGAGDMPSHSAQIISEKDRWSLVLYIRKLQGVVRE